jgi:hypothetical protein
VCASTSMVNALVSDSLACLRFQLCNSYSNGDHAATSCSLSADSITAHVDRRAALEAKTHIVHESVDQKEIHLLESSKQNLLPLPTPWAAAAWHKMPPAELWMNMDVYLTRPRLELGRFTKDSTSPTSLLFRRRWE